MEEWTNWNFWTFSLAFWLFRGFPLPRYTGFGIFLISSLCGIFSSEELPSSQAIFIYPCSTFSSYVLSARILNLEGDTVLKNNSVARVINSVFWGLFPILTTNVQFCLPSISHYDLYRSPSVTFVWGTSILLLAAALISLGELCFPEFKFFGGSITSLFSFAVFLVVIPTFTGVTFRKKPWICYPSILITTRILATSSLMHLSVLGWSFCAEPTCS